LAIETKRSIDLKHTLYLVRQLVFRLFVFCCISLFALQVNAQEIEARAYSNAPIGINFITGGIAQAKSSTYKLTTEVINLTHVLDVAGQSGRLTLVLPYAELTGAGQVGKQVINASQHLYSYESRMEAEGWENFPTESALCGGDDGIPTQLDGITFSKWRQESIKGYGNAIVPQVAYEIFKVIQTMHHAIPRETN
jgi:hypothetical protein